MSDRTKRTLAYIGVVLAVLWAIYQTSQNRDAIHQINTERTARQQGLVKLIKLSCHANSDQDRTLATLLAVSLAQPNPPDVTAQELAARKVFERELSKLQKPARCRAQVLIFLNPKGVDAGSGNSPSGLPPGQGGGSGPAPNAPGPAGPQGPQGPPGEPSPPLIPSPLPGVCVKPIICRL